MGISYERAGTALHTRMKVLSYFTGHPLGNTLLLKQAQYKNEFAKSTRHGSKNKRSEGATLQYSVT